jgi:predicted transcriptional regulator
MGISDILARKSNAVIMICQKDILQSAIDSMHAAVIGSFVVVNASKQMGGLISMGDLLVVRLNS